MNILITGNRGFIGSHLHQSLVGKGHKVIGIDNMMHPSWNDVPYEYVDVRNISDLKPYFSHCDLCFHLAAQISVDKSILNPQETIDINVLGTQNILECARKFHVKVVFASSSEVYGSSNCEFMGESHPLDAFSPYGASKVAGDRMCHAYYKTFGTDVVIVRNFNTFGEYQSDDSYGGVISKFVTQALNNMPLVVYGNGSQERDYMHISDAIRAYELAMRLEGCGEAINFGTGKTQIIRELANKVIGFSGAQSQITYADSRKGEVQRLCADIRRARELGFVPTTDFDTNLKGYIQWKKDKL